MRPRKSYPHCNVGTVGHVDAPQVLSVEDANKMLKGMREIKEDAARMRAECDALLNALAPFAKIGKHLHESGSETLIGASARFLKLEPLIGADFVAAYHVSEDIGRLELGKDHFAEARQSEAEPAVQRPPMLRGA